MGEFLPLSKVCFCNTSILLEDLETLHKTANFKSYSYFTATVTEIASKWAFTQNYTIDQWKQL